MNNITLQIESGSNITLGIESGRSAVYYTGEYEVTPKRQEQELATRELTMRRNVVVHEIPYFKTANPYGNTFVIGE